MHLSRRFTAQGRAHYPNLLREAVHTGNEDSLSAALVQQQYFAEHESHSARIRRVPGNATRTFAEGQFNTFTCAGCTIGPPNLPAA